MDSRKQHWEKIHSNTQPHEVSWTEAIPKTSLEFIHGFELSKDACIIDVGGGDSKLVDYLLLEGFQNITVLDISEKAIGKAQKRLGKKASLANWIVSDIMDFSPPVIYDCWHDRATFHFLTKASEVAKYLDIAQKSISHYMVIGTFSDEGPDKCSLLDVHQYSELELQEQFKDGFKKIRCKKENHTTPFKTLQNFLFCSFRKRGN